MQPLAIDLFCGLGGWTEGLLAENYYVVGFDIERHQYFMPDGDYDGDGSKGTKPIENRGWTQGCAVSLGMEGANAKARTRLVEYPAQLVLQDILTLHGKQFKDAALIVASPPCQEFSYMAMPWSKAKEKRRKILADPAERKRLTALFDACFRIQREAIEVAGHHIPMVVENVRGAQKWVGRSRWNYGSYHLWGDAPALMPMSKAIQKFNPDGTAHPAGSWFAIANSKNRGSQHQKNTGGSWFGIDPRGNSIQPNNARDELKTVGHINQRDGRSHTRPLTNQVGSDGRVKHHGDWFDKAGMSPMRKAAHGSTARKAASAAIAMIPFALARYIAQVYRP